MTGIMFTSADTGGDGNLAIITVVRILCSDLKQRYIRKTSIDITRKSVEADGTDILPSASFSLFLRIAKREKVSG